MSYLIAFCLILSSLILSKLLSSQFCLSCLICYLSTLSFSFTLLECLLTSSPLFHLIFFYYLSSSRLICRRLVSCILPFFWVMSRHIASCLNLQENKQTTSQQDDVTLKQPSQSFLPSGHPTCQSCSVARPLQRKGWLHCRLQHKEESSSLKYLGSEFNLKGVKARSFHSSCASV